MIGRILRTAEPGVLVTLSLVGLAGCGAGLVRLTYPAPITPPNAAAQGKALSVARFADARKNKKAVAAQRLALQIGQIELKKPNSAGGWVARALAAELTHAGCRVQLVDRRQQARDAVVVSGTVLEIFSDDYRYVIHSTVRFTLTVRKGGAIVLGKEYEGDASQPRLSGLMSTGDYEKGIAAALQDAMTQAVPDIIRAMR